MKTKKFIAQVNAKFGKVFPNGKSIVTAEAKSTRAEAESALTELVASLPAELIKAAGVVMLNA